MNHREPPALATWLLNHLTSKWNNEALSGDLLETFRAGRSVRWYWYQVIAAIALAWGRDVWRHRDTLIFAAMWSIFSPAWIVLETRFNVGSLVGYTSRLPWPLSFGCDFVLSVMVSSLFIWLGVAVYSTFHLLAFGGPSLRWVGKGFLWGLLAYALGRACLITTTILHPGSHAVDARTFTMLGRIEDFGIWNELLRLPYFIGTVITLWILASRSKRTPIRAE